MSQERAPRPFLVFGFGNPSRGDDALGPELVTRLAQAQAAGALPQVELLTDFQLQVEHALDLRGRTGVLFADASLTAAAPFSLDRLRPARDPSYTSHAMSPGALLWAYRSLEGRDPPPSLLLSIRGYRFELGRVLSPQAAHNLSQGLRWMRSFLEESCPWTWCKKGSEGHPSARLERWVSRPLRAG